MSYNRNYTLNTNNYSNNYGGTGSNNLSTGRFGTGGGLTGNNISSNGISGNTYNSGYQSSFQSNINTNDVKTKGTIIIPKNFPRKEFVETIDNLPVRLKMVPLATLDQLNGYTIEELRYLDYRIKTGQNIQGTPQFNKSGFGNNFGGIGTNNITSNTGNVSTVKINPNPTSGFLGQNYSNFNPINNNTGNTMNTFNNNNTTGNNPFANPKSLGGVMNKNTNNNFLSSIKPPFNTGMNTNTNFLTNTTNNLGSSTNYGINSGIGLGNTGNMINNNPFNSNSNSNNPLTNNFIKPIGMNTTTNNNTMGMGTGFNSTSNFHSMNNFNNMNTNNNVIGGGMNSSLKNPFNTGSTLPQTQTMNFGMSNNNNMVNNIFKPSTGNVTFNSTTNNNTSTLNPFLRNTNSGSMGMGMGIGLGTGMSNLGGNNTMLNTISNNPFSTGTNFNSGMGLGTNRNFGGNSVTFMNSNNNQMKQGWNTNTNNNNFNQHQNLNQAYQLMKEIETDYLGINSMFREVENKMMNRPFSKREIEEAFGIVDTPNPIKGRDSLDYNPFLLPSNHNTDQFGGDQRSSGLSFSNQGITNNPFNKLFNPFSRNNNPFTSNNNHLGNPSINRVTFTNQFVGGGRIQQNLPRFGTNLNTITSSYSKPLYSSNFTFGGNNNNNMNHLNVPNNNLNPYLTTPLRVNHFQRSVHNNPSTLINPRSRSASSDSWDRFEREEKEEERRKKVPKIEDILPLGKKKIEEKIQSRTNNKDLSVDSNEDMNLGQILGVSTQNNTNNNKSFEVPLVDDKVRKQMKEQNEKYYKSQEFLEEIKYLSEMAHKKCVGPLTTSKKLQGNNNNNNNNLSINSNPGFNFSDLKKLSTNNNNPNNYFQNTLSNNKPIFKTSNKLSTKFKLGVIPESSQELSVIDNTPLKNRNININEDSESVLFNNNNKVHSNLNNNNNNFASNLNSNSNFNNEPITFNLFSKSNEKKERKTESPVYNLYFKISRPVEHEFNLYVNMRNKGKDLRSAVKDILVSNFAELLGEIREDQIGILTKRGMLRDEEVLEDNKLIMDRDILNVVICDFENPVIDSRSEISKRDFEHVEPFDVISDNSSFFSKSMFKEFKPDYVPITKKYNTIPNVEEMMKMSKDQLERVKNFTIYNEFGKIVFLGQTDVTYLNLDEIVEISFKFINVYSVTIPPNIGEKLNKHALIELYNMEFEGTPEEIANFSDTLKNSLTEMRGHFRYYDNPSATLCFEVADFNNNRRRHGQE